MSIKHIDGFDQLAGQVGAALLASLSGSGYTVTSNLSLADGRKVGGKALQLNVAAGAAGESWSSRTNNVDGDLHGAAVNSAGRVVAVGNDGNATYSDDNVSWLPLVLGVTANMKAIANNNNTWIAVGDNGTILRSTDGRNYTPRIAPILAANLRDVAFGNGIWIAVGVNGAAGVVFNSIDDGLTWTQVSVGVVGILNCVQYGGANWVVGGNAGAILTSPDGATWATTTVGVAGTVADVQYGTSGRWLAVVGTEVRRSADGGTTWTSAAVNLPVMAAITELEGRWIAVGANGSVRMSDNETVWTTPAFAGAASTPLYDVVTARGAKVGYVVVGAKNIAEPAATRRALIYVSLAPPTNVTRRFTTDAATIVIGFAHRATSRGRILTIPGVLDMDWSAGISIGGEVGIAVPARNVWYYYELVINRAALTVDLYINNMLDLTAPVDAGVATLEDFDVTWMAENGAVARIDDLYFLDNLAPGGETLNARLGPISIPLRLPDSDAGPNEWATASGSAHWPQVGLLPPSTESYIRSATSGKQDMFRSSTPLPAGAGTVDAPIIAVGVIALAQKGDIDNRQIGLAVGTGVDQIEVIDTALSTVPEYSVGIFEKAPGDVDWTAANVLTTPFGVIVRP